MITGRYSRPKIGRSQPKIDRSRPKDIALGGRFLYAATGKVAYDLELVETSLRVLMEGGPVLLRSATTYDLT